MRILGRYFRGYRRESVLAPLFKMLEALLDLLVPIFVAWMIDTDIRAGGMDRVVWYFAALLGLALLGLGFSVVAQFFAAKASVGFTGALRQALFDHIQTFSHGELDRLGGDMLITCLADDTNQVQTGLNMSLRLLLRSPFIVFGAMAAAFAINVRCGLVFLVAIPVLFTVIFLIMKWSIPLFGRVQAGLDKVTALTRENLTGVRVIRAFCREAGAVEEFEVSNKGLTRLNLQVGRLSALMNPLTYVLINIAAVVLIQQSAMEVELGALPQGQVVALYNYILQITVELIKLASLIITLNKSVACAKRTAQILQVQPAMTYPAQDAPEPQPGAPAIAFEDVSFTYPGAGGPSLSHITFSVGEGQTVGVIGGTGSGKSTLVNLIQRAYDPAQGVVLLRGQRADTLSRQQLCQMVGVVPQRAMLFQGTIRENLAWGKEDATEEEMWRALTLAQARQVVEEKPGGLDFHLEPGGRNLSGGQRQRLTIARAVVKRPDILILDDSSSALDYATDAALRRALYDRAERTTTVLVSQRIASVRQADLILVLDNGALVGAGTHEQLLEQCPVYRGIYDSQVPEEPQAAGITGGVQA